MTDHPLPAVPASPASDAKLPHHGGGYVVLPRHDSGLTTILEPVLVRDGNHYGVWL